ncbi:MAG: hypothetical protein ACQESG_03700 [Nanobdellota archaeon]
MVKKKLNTLSRGLQHATLYWVHSSYVSSGLAEEYLNGELLYGM